MIDTSQYASAVEIPYREEWTLSQTRRWLQDNGIQYPQHGWIIGRSLAEELRAKLGSHV